MLHALLVLALIQYHGVKEHARTVNQSAHQTALFVHQDMLTVKEFVDDDVL